MSKCYAGLGSRAAKSNICDVFFSIAASLALKGYTLRSGGADGSDLSFQLGAESVKGKAEIYLPWRNFNGNKSNLYNVSDEALELASTIHPAWDRCSRGARLLHGRNTYQILSETLQDPVEFVICWTENGVVKGGTATAITLARQRGIPVYNFGCELDVTAFYFNYPFARNER